MVTADVGQSTAAPLPGVRRIESQADARVLAHRLLIPGRRWPVVVLTIAGGQDDPFGDPDEIKEAVGGLAEVVLMPTSDVSWAFSDEMPSMTQVYGGAGRVYPVHHAWVSTPGLSKLRFAYSPQDRQRITDQLINDALEAALAAGLVEARTSPDVRQRSGTVQGVIGSRALVVLDNGSPATVWEELTVPGVPLTQVVAKGQHVAGAYDPVPRRLDLRSALRYTDAASAEAAVAQAYQVGDAVLADVTEVADDAVLLRLLPGLAVEVDREAVTSNPNDTLRGLFTIGEALVCHIASTEPLRLRLDDVNDEEVVKPAPSLLPGGPPWLRLPDPPRPEVAVVEPAPSPLIPAVEPASPAPDVAPRRPTPLDLARRSTAPAPRSPQARHPAGVSADVSRASVEELSNELAAERATRKGLANELARLRERAAELEDEMAQATQKIERLRTRYRSADLARQRAVKALQSRLDQPPDGDAGAFLDPEEQFQYEVYREWARRVPAAEKASKPLASYILGPDFLRSLDDVEGVSRSKVVAVVAEVLTNQVQHLAGRDLHRLRTGPAGSPYMTRGDGATCWRVALQRESAAARRLHYWRTRDGYELSRVVLHDDYRP
jgi:hypothetical protein